ncbi:MAG: exodeoxyribonuclease VII large subunit [Candidatus Dormibacteraeota bacterium]|nr:exodeoxyribonuclease VII large subunit [Candidatus Dormibacteraeota bacterium]
MQVLKVGDLAEYIDEVFSQEQGLQDVWVEGEVASCTVSVQGHCYLTLKDERASIRGVLFRASYARIGFLIQSGMMLLAHGRVNFYRDRGETQLLLDTAQPSGVGGLYLAFEQLKNRLEAEGLFDPRHKRRPPAFPRKVAIVTSESGAALRDVLKVLRRRCPAVPALVVHALVQGDVAAASVVRALKRAAQRPGVEVILLVRGGGAIEDLASFNDESLARAIRACPVPVIVGVGHETDFTIADFAADVRAATPSQAAEMAVPDQAQLRRDVLAQRERLNGAIAREAATKAEALRVLGERLDRQSPERQVPLMRQRLDDRAQRLEAALRVGLDRAKQRLQGHSDRLEALSPIAVLGRGYSLARDEQGALVTSVAGLRPGRRLTTVFADGSAEAEITSVTPNAGADTAPVPALEPGGVDG